MKINGQQIFFLVLSILILGCLGSKPGLYEKWFAEKRYQEIVERGVDCEDGSPTCFRSNLFLARSYHQLGQDKAALKLLRDILKKGAARARPSDFVSAELLRDHLLLDKIDILDNFETKRSVLYKFEANLRQTIQQIRQLPGNGQKILLQDGLELLAETFLVKMDLTVYDSLKVVYQDISRLCDEMNQLDQEGGHSAYFLFRGKIRLVLPGVKHFLFTGQGDREKLMLALNTVRNDAAQLAAQFTYPEKYQKKIELSLKEIDFYLEQLVQ